MMRPGQTGLTLLGLLAGLMVLGLLITLAARIAPAYYEHERVVAILHGIRDSGALSDASDQELRNAFERRAEVDDVHSVLPADLQIDHFPAGNKAISVQYAAKVPLILNISLLMDFAADTGVPGGKP